MTQTVVIPDEKLAKDFTITVYGSSIVSHLEALIESNNDPENSDYPAVGSANSYLGREITQAERDNDMTVINQMLDIFRDPELTKKFVRENIHPQQPTKKNGSYSKNRVVNHAQFDSFRVYWEDYYGDNTPAIRCRSTSSYEATLSFENYIVKY